MRGDRRGWSCSGLLNLGGLGSISELPAGVIGRTLLSRWSFLSLAVARLRKRCCCIARERLGTVGFELVARSREGQRIGPRCLRSGLLQRMGLGPRHPSDRLFAVVEEHPSLFVWHVIALEHLPALRRQDNALWNEDPYIDTFTALLDLVAAVRRGFDVGRPGAHAAPPRIAVGLASISYRSCSAIIFSVADR